MTIRLDGQVAIVTGAGQGLGRCHALALAERGANVVVNDLGDASGVSANADSVVAEINAQGGEAISHGANVAEFSQVEDMVKQAMDRWGRVDILINNAGILRDKTFHNMTPELLDPVLDVHLKGAFYVTRPAWVAWTAVPAGTTIRRGPSSWASGNHHSAGTGR